MNEVLGLSLIAVGIIYDLLACVGLVRMPDIYTRLQTATKAVTIGTGCILIGAALYFGIGPASAKAVLCMGFVLLTNPASAHVIARAAHLSGIRVERVTADGLLGREIESELWDVTKKRDRFQKNRLISILESCMIMDIKEHISSGSLFEVVSHPLGLSLGIEPGKIRDKLREREKESVTALKPDFAIPHIIVEGQGMFELIAVRARKGVWFSKECPNVNSVFVIAGSQDEWHFYLRFLAAIAQIVKSEDFFKKWDSAKNEHKIRRLLAGKAVLISK